MLQKDFIARNQTYKTYNLKQSSRFLPTTKKTKPNNKKLRQKSPTLRNLTINFEPKKSN
jgi:hypothetical protein